MHDTDHPGVGNPYMVNTKHPLAVRLGEAPKAVLETHHAEMAIALLDRPELDFIAGLGAEARARYCALIRENVLHTDVTTTMGAAKAFAERRPSVATMQFEEEARKSAQQGDAAANKGQIRAEQVMCLIIKAADISNPARPLNVYSRWIEGVMTEFFTQGDAEKSRSLAVSMNCDRGTVQLAPSQIGFITFLVQPLYKALLAYSPSLQPVFDILEANRLHFVKEAEAAKALEVEKTPPTPAK